MTKETNNSILDRLKLRERFDRRILKEFDDVLYHAFQVIYEVDAIVEWERIFRFSTESNFITVSGRAVVPEGTILAGGQTLTKPVEIFPSFTFPWILLDEGASAYEIAEAAKDLKIFGTMIGGNKLFDYLRSPQFTYDSMKLSLPDYQTLDDAGVVPVETNKDEIDLDEITASQLRIMSIEEEDD